MRRFLALVLVTLPALAFAATAGATAPVVVEKNRELTRHFTGLDECAAFGFTTTAHFEIRRTVMDFYDRDGSLVRTVIHVHFVGTATNESTGASLPVNGQRHIVLDYVDGTFTETGVLRHVTAPGQGIVLHEAGRIVLGLTDDAVLFEAGPHQLWHGDVAAFCTALASA